MLTIMKGEHDALLEWPLQLIVTLTIPERQCIGDTVQSFKPNPNIASFPVLTKSRLIYNVASGCPKFAPLSVLDNQEFIVEDVAFTYIL